MNPNKEEIFDLINKEFRITLFFGDTGVWTKGLILARQALYHLSLHHLANS
jgi:hypothetical protein